MHLRDMLKAIDLIEQFIDGIDFQAYLADFKTQAAVERELQIVTEAAYRRVPHISLLRCGFAEHLPTQYLPSP